MNKVYKVVWSTSRNCYVVGSEFVKRHTKGKGSGIVKTSSAALLALALITGSIFFGAETAYAATGLVLNHSTTDTTPENTGTDKATAVGNNDIAIGSNASAESGMAIGTGTNADAGVAIGFNAKATSPTNGKMSALAIGAGTTATGKQALALGGSSVASADQSTAIGNDAYATQIGAIVIGGDDTKDPTSVGRTGNIKGSPFADDLLAASKYGYARADQTGTKAVPYFRQSVSTGIGALTVGVHGQALSNGSTAIGVLATAGDGNVLVLSGDDAAATLDANKTNNTEATAIGAMSHAQNEYSTAIGRRAQALAVSATAIGNTAIASGANAIAIGSEAKVQDAEITNMDGDVISTSAAVNSIAVGTSSVAQGNSSVAIGSESLAKVDGAIAIGNQAAKDIIVTSQFGTTKYVAIGANAGQGALISNSALFIGKQSGQYSEGNDNTYIGSANAGYKATGSYNTAIGYDALKNAQNAHNNVAVGSNAGAEMSVGTNNTILGNHSGGHNQYSSYNVMVGDNVNDSMVSVSRATALGSRTVTTVSGSVALGAYSVADTKAGKMGYDAILNGDSENKNNPTWQSTFAGVSVGGKTKVYSDGNDSDDLGEPKEITVTRQINYVAAGSADTDAVNVAQLKQVRGLSSYFHVNTGDANQVAGDRRTNAGPVDSKGGATVKGAMAVGLNTIVTGEDAIAMGTSARASAVSAIAIGNGAQATGEQSISLGTGNIVSGAHSGAIGDPNTVSGTESYVLGNDNTVTTDKTFVLGNTVTTTAANSVFLGDSSAYVESGATTKGLDAYTGDTVAGKTISFAGGNAVSGVVSIGSSTGTRRIQNVAAGLISATSTDAVNGSQLYAVAASLANNISSSGTSDSAAVKTELIADGMNYAGDSGDTIHKDLGNTLKVTGGATGELTDNNIGVVSENGELKVKLAKEITGLTFLKVDRLDVGQNSTHITDTDVETDTLKVGNVTINKDTGINAGGQKITNVADGTENGDAVNYGQLRALQGNMGELGDRINKVGAGAAALAALHPLDFDPDDKWDVAAGYGNYKDAHAMAVGAFYRPNEDTMVSVGGSFGGGNNMVNAGVSVKLGQGNHVSTSKVAMAKEIVDLRNENKDLKERLDSMEQKMNTILGILDTNKKTDFPDVPENHWAYKYVSELAGNGILEGYPDGNFSGDRTMTRYEFAAMLYRALINGAPVNADMDRAMNEFEPELRQIRLDRIRVDRISGKDDDRNKVERVRVNNEDDLQNKVYRDVYGTQISR